MSRQRDHEQDRAVNAVRRVRSVREQDSRIGLQQAVQERRTASGRVAALRRRLADADDFVSGTATGFLLGRTTLQALGSALREAEETWESSGTVVESARSQWRTDHARLLAIDLLLARRAAMRRAEQARREARELDDLAGQRWLRDQEDGPS